MAAGPESLIVYAPQSLDRKNSYIVLVQQHESNKHSLRRQPPAPRPSPRVLMILLFLPPGSTKGLFLVLLSPTLGRQGHQQARAEPRPQGHGRSPRCGQTATGFAASYIGTASVECFLVAALLAGKATPGGVTAGRRLGPRKAGGRGHGGKGCHKTS